MSKDFKSKFSSLRRRSQVQANEERRRKSVSINLVGPVHQGPFFNLTRLHEIQESGRSQHSGSSLTSTGSDSSSGPTSPEHVLNAGTEEGASGETAAAKRVRSRGFKSLFKKTSKSGDQPKPDGSSPRQNPETPDWTAADSNLSNEAIMETMRMFKENKLTEDQAWEMAMEMEMEQRRKKESKLDMTQLPPTPVGEKSPERTRSSKANKLKNNGSRSAEQSPLTPSDTDSARGTEGATGSDESLPSTHNYYEPTELYPGVIDVGDSKDTSLEDRMFLPESRVDMSSRLGADGVLSLAGPSIEDNMYPVGDGQPAAAVQDQDGLTFINSHAEMVCCSEEQLPNMDETISISEFKMGLERTNSVELEHARRYREGRDSGSNSPPHEDKGEYLEPTTQGNRSRRTRAASSPAIPVWSLSETAVSDGHKKPSKESSKGGKSISQMFRSLQGTLKKPQKTTPSPAQSPSGSDQSSLDRDSTLSSFSSASSKSSVEPENKRPTNLVDPKFLNSQGEYIGPYNNLAICIQDNQPSPYDKDGLSLKVGDLVYITMKQGGSWEGVCGQRRGKFKFISVRVLSPKEEEKRKESVEMDLGENDDGSDTTPSETMPKLSSLKELLERIECEQYYSIFQLHDFGTLEQFKYLESSHLGLLNIVDPEHKVKILTAAQILRDPKSGKDRAASQQLQGLLWPTRIPSGRMSTRDSGFYASTETCVSIESTGLLRRSEAGDSLIEECETGYHDDDVTDASLQENSNVNNSNCINAARNQNGSNGGRLGNKPCRHGPPAKSNRNGQHPLSGSPQCPRKEGNGSASPLAHHVCRVHTNGSSTKCAQQVQHHQQQQLVTVNPAWTDMAPYRDSPVFKHRHLVATFSDPGSAPNSPRIRASTKQPQRHHVKTGCSQDHQCPSPDVVPRVSSEDRARWRRSALLEMYGIQDSSRLRGSGHIIQSSISKTHPSPKLSRHVMEQYQYHAHNAALQQQVSSPAPKGRRKSRSVSPNKRHHHHHHHHQHRELLLSNNSVHASPTLPLRATKSPRQQGSVQLEWIVERTLRHEGIDLKEEPYSNKMGFCGIPSALVQRYAEELEAEVSEVAVCLESIRVRELVNACRCWFRSDTLSNQSGKIVYAGTGSTVEEWLTSLGLPMYIDTFTLSGWDEMDIVVHMEEDDLEKCGIEKTWHLRRLTTALEHLKMSWKPV
ncbi:SAM and SH3 domain-containing protein 1-like isoform X5 [Asterias amurensis]|uniref:SAM and SH3 domain-containing protein 1-like isoform X5 n=1 Tax=Asterias amurensis TaxID=7602 RepID=UPI003AB3C185